MSCDGKDKDNEDKKYVWLKRQRHKNKYVCGTILEWIFILSKHDIYRGYISIDNIYFFYSQNIIVKNS